MDLRPFKGKVFAVTGGASGIGGAACTLFGTRGARVAVIDMDRKRIRQKIKDLSSKGIDCRGYICDVSRERECFAVMKKIIMDFGGIDILFNNAGITQRSAFADTGLPVYRKIMDVDFFGTVNCTKAAIPSLMKNRGMIIVTSSIAGFAPIIGRSGYSAAKHALHGFYGVLRSELKESGVHVMLVCPGFTRTNLQDRALDGDGSITKHPQSKTGKESTPDAVARAIYHAARKKKKMIVLTPVGKISYYLNRFAPGLFDMIQARQLRSELER